MEEPKFARRAPAPNMASRLMEHIWIAYTALILVVILILSYIGLNWQTLWALNDSAGTPVAVGHGTVTSKQLRDWRGRFGAGWDIQLTVNGKVATAHVLNRILGNELVQGEEVAVRYRTGKSGTVYVTDLERQGNQRVSANPALR